MQTGTQGPTVSIRVRIPQWTHRTYLGQTITFRVEDALLEEISS